MKKHGNSTHGMTWTAEHRAWLSMRNRCHNPKASGFAKYGARGITVCQKWRDSFEAFYADMGKRPSPLHSIDRKDVNGHYEPENCRWATPIEQANNKTNNRFIELDGRTLTLAQWSRESGIDADVISLRIDSGWDTRTAIFEPKRKSATGIKGIYFQPSRKRWNVRFNKDGKLCDLGRFETLLDAAAALLGNVGRDAGYIPA
jgi:hypothetical protein